MSRYKRVIATEGRVRGDFVVHGSSRGPFSVGVLEVVLYDEDRNWGQIIRDGDIEIRVDAEGVATVFRALNPDKAAVIEDYTALINETLTLVLRAYGAGPGSVVEPTAASPSNRTPEEEQ